MTLTFRSFRRRLLGEGFLEDHEKKRIAPYWDRNEDKNAFSDHAFPEGAYSTRFPLQSKGNLEPHPAVTSHLDEHGWKVHDYRAGLASHKQTGRVMKIGRVLHKTGADDDTMRKFSEDRARTGARTGDWDVYISRHPHDVGRASGPSQSWESCLSLDRCGKEVEHGSHVAYLVKSSDHEAEHPRARILLKKMTNMDDPSDHVLRPELPYGSAPPEFYERVREWSERNFPFRPGAHYEKHPEVYSDRDSRIYGEWSPHHSFRGEKVWKFHENMAARHDISREKLSQYLAHERPLVRMAASDNPNMTDEHYQKVLADPDPSVRLAGMMSRNVKPHHVTQYLTDPGNSDNDKSAVVRANRHLLGREQWDAVFTHGGPETIATALHSGGPGAIKHVTGSHISTAIRRHVSVYGIFRHPAATDDHRIMALDHAQNHEQIEAIFHGLNSDNERIFDHFYKNVAPKLPGSQRYMFQAQRVPDKYIELAKYHKDDDFAEAAARHVTDRPEKSHHIDDFLEHPSPRVRAAAVLGRGAKPHHLDRAIRDEDEEVRYNAIENPNVGTHHLKYVVDHDDDELNVDVARMELHRRGNTDV